MENEIKSHQEEIVLSYNQLYRLKKEMKELRRILPSNNENYALEKFRIKTREDFIERILNDDSILEMIEATKFRKQEVMTRKLLLRQEENDDYED